MDFLKFVFTKKFLTHLGLALLATLLFIFLLTSWLAFRTNHGKEVTVPILDLMLIDEAEEKLDKANLKYVLLDTLDYYPTKPKFAILFQEPKPGVKVKPNRKVYVKINAGDYKQVIVPDLVQKSYRQVENTFRVIGLQIGDTLYKPFLGKDIVLEMTYKGKPLIPGSKLKKTSKVDFVLGDGKISYYDGNNETEPFRNTPIEEIEVPDDF